MSDAVLHSTMEQQLEMPSLVHGTTYFWDATMVHDTIGINHTTTPAS